MQINRVLITGASGVGSSSLAEVLSRRLGWFWLDLDKVYWSEEKPAFTIKRPIEVRNRLLEELLSKYQKWVISGSIMNWGTSIIPQIDLVVFLQVPTDERIRRIRTREELRFGSQAIGHGGEREEIFNKFIDWASSYDQGTQSGRSLERHNQWLSEMCCPVLRIEGIQSNEERTSEILNFIYSKQKIY